MSEVEQKGSVNPTSGSARRVGDLEREAERSGLGRAIRTRRQERGLTLSDVAGATGLSISLISQVERGLVDPSLESLREIARALDTTPFRLLEVGHVVSHHVRDGEGLRLALPDADVEYELLSPGSDGTFQIAKAELVPGGSTTRIQLSHPGEETVMALHGAIAFELGDERIALGEGDAITFDPRIPHRCVADLDGPATVLIIVSPPTL